MLKRKPRRIRKKETDVPEGYDSHFEARLHDEVLNDKWEYVPTPAPNPIFYTVEHTYHPDFVLKEDGLIVYLEAKGRFWDYAEHNKYKWIAKHLEDHEELVFLFAMPHAPMPATRKRKDGTKYSHAEWAEKNGFRWFDEFNLPEEWKRDEI